MSIPAALAYGALAGYAIAIPLGAIGLLILRTALARGFKGGAAAGLGAATVDLAFCTLAFLAGGAVGPTLRSWGDTPLYVSAAVLIGIGLVQLRGALRPSAEAKPLPSHGSIYVRFIALTAINPATVLYFAALAGTLASQDADAGARAAFVVAVGLASASWQLGLAAAGSVLHRAASPRVSKVLSVTGSLIVVGLGLAVLARAVWG